MSITGIFAEATATIVASDTTMSVVILCIFRLQYSVRFQLMRSSAKLDKYVRKVNTTQAESMYKDHNP